MLFPKHDLHICVSSADFQDGDFDKAITATQE